MIGENIKKHHINWLLFAFMAVSVAIHAGIFLQMSGAVDFKRASYIPIRIRKDIKPPARAIPKPPARPPAPSARKPHPVMVPDNTVPSVAPVPEESDHIKPVEMPPPEALMTDSVPEPEAAEGKAPEVTPEAVPGEATPSLAEPAADVIADSRMNYFNTARLKIESHKQYPEVARQQHMEGQVIVEFVINPDGSVSGLMVASSSGFESLDAAAVSAVKNAAPFSPLPEKYFNGPALVKIPIAFEIIQ